MTGTTDVVLLEAQHIPVVAVKNNILVQVELKKSDNLKSNLVPAKAQSIGQFLCSAVLSSKNTLQVLTDLVDEWYFYWFASTRRAILSCKASREEAFFLLQYSVSTPPNNFRTCFPEEFLTRGKWSMPQRLSRINESDDSNGKNGKNSDIGGGGRKSSSSSSIPLSSSSSSSAHSARPDSVVSSHMSYDWCLGVRDSLADYVPNDVACELDLLYALDETEQESVLLDFIGKHVVPTMISGI